MLDIIGPTAGTVIYSGHPTKICWINPDAIIIKISSISCDLHLFSNVVSLRSYDVLFPPVLISVLCDVFQIRKTAADQVYLVLLQNGNLVAEGQMERALEILAETCWEGALEESKIGRLQLYEIAGLEASAALKTSGATVNKSSRMNVVTDENASYSSLVDSSGF